MSVKIEVNGEVVVAYLSGDIDHHTAKPMREEIDKAVEENMPSLLVLDFKDVSFMDSSGIGVIMGRYKLIYLLGGEVWATHTNERMKKIFHSTHLVYDTIIKNVGLFH